MFSPACSILFFKNIADVAAGTFEPFPDIDPDLFAIFLNPLAKLFESFPNLTTGLLAALFDILPGLLKGLSGFVTAFLASSFKVLPACLIACVVSLADCFTSSVN